MGFQLPFPQLVSESRSSGCHQLRMGHFVAIKNSSPGDSRYMLVYIREDCAADVLKVPDPVEAIDLNEQQQSGNGRENFRGKDGDL